MVSNPYGSVYSIDVAVSVSVAPAITRQPQSASVAVGSPVSLAVQATGTPALTYQWLKGGLPILGANGSSLIIPSALRSDAGSYSVRVTNSAGEVTSVPAALLVTPASALSNLSVRSSLLPDQTLIVGAVMSGGAKPVLLRAAGPALKKFGLSGMPDPRLELYNGQMLAGSNDNWSASIGSAFGRVGAFAFDAGSLDAALSQTLSGDFTVHARGSGSGVVLVEAYDSGDGMAARLVNLSARNFVGTGADVLIAGFTLNGGGSKQLLIRAVGPTLSQFGVSGPLVDPRLTLFTSSGVPLAENDNWDASVASTFTQVGAFALPAGSRDAALLVTLNGGAAYTVQVSGANGATGEALIEIYEVF